MTHADLVSVAAKWLSGHCKCSVVLTELATTGETPDAIGWCGTHSTLVECKTSMADFMADASKFFRRNPEEGLGQCRYFLALPGVIPCESLPAGWGLLELIASKVRKVRPSALHVAHHRHEIGLLLSTLRRIGRTPPRGVSIRAYTIDTMNRATLGIELEASA